MRILSILLVLCTLVLSGCSVGGGGYGLATMAVGYWLTDPLAPNWTVNMDVASQENNLYKIQLNNKLYTTGGNGEARVIFRNAAEQLVAQERAQGYIIITYEEGLDSEFLGGRRYARGVIQLRPAAKSPGAAMPQGWLDAKR